MGISLQLQMALTGSKQEEQVLVVHWENYLTMAWIHGLQLSFPYACTRHLAVLI